MFRRDASRPDCVAAWKTGGEGRPNNPATRAGLLPLCVAVVVLLGAGVATCGPAYAEFFLKKPVLVAAGAAAAFLAYLPTLWVARRLDPRPSAWYVQAFAALFVFALSPVVSHVTRLLTQQGILYWKFAGIVKETAKLLPVLIVVLTDSAQDFMGKMIAPLSIGAVGRLLLSAGVPETDFAGTSPFLPALLVTGAVINTVLINVFVLPILWWLLRPVAGRSRRESRQADS